ncbi:hypothetical protein J9303_06570 [Bacillaceae bacterium Marseille-Q3522]|nr:hypothetical protein [Bacillaceae bacterium Marseille-Q3522]
MYEKVAKECDKDESLFLLLNDRLYTILEDSSEIGWGYHDELAHIYYSIKWVEEE